MKTQKRAPEDIIAETSSDKIFTTLLFAPFVAGIIALVIMAMTMN